jgi:hypothetical protein
MSTHKWKRTSNNQEIKSNEFKDLKGTLESKVK